MRLGIVLLVIFCPNLIFSLFFTYGESFASHIPAIAISIPLIIWGIYRIKTHLKKAND